MGGSKVNNKPDRYFFFSSKTCQDLIPKKKLPGDLSSLLSYRYVIT